MTTAAMVFWAVLAVLVTGFSYWVASMLWPFTACRKCKGSGSRRSPSGKNYGRCRRCKGKGERLRFGRKVINKIGITKDKLVG
jgi:hypothetical protein